MQGLLRGCDCMRHLVFARRIITLGLALSVYACNDPLPGQSDKTVDVQTDRKSIALTPDADRYTKGLGLYQQTCAACHGRQGEGAVNWQRRDEQGQYKPPPLNGSGHTWHHPKQVLMDIIRNGTVRLGGNMPAWKEKLSDAEIEDILYWVQSQWPQEIYQAWYRNNEEVMRNTSPASK